MLAKLVCLCLLVGAAMAATFQGRAPKIPAELSHKKGCYVQEMNDVIPLNSMVTPPGHCYRVECGGGMLYYASCGVVFSDDPKCHKTEEDLSKPYPECCSTIKCESENQV